MVKIIKTWSASAMLILLICFSADLSVSLDAQKVYDVSWSKDLKLSLPGLAMLGYSMKKRADMQAVDWRLVQTWDRSEVPAYDRSATYNYSHTAKQVSDYLNIGLMLSPAAFVFSDRARNEKYAVAVLYSETLLWATAVTRFTKVTFQRRRPFVFNDEATFDRKPQANARTSFISGHTTASAAVAFLSASLYQDFYPDRDHVWCWTAAITLPMVVGYARYEAGEHYLTDVAAAYAIGAAIGWAIPQLHQNRHLAFSPTSDGLGMYMNITF